VTNAANYELGRELGHRLLGTADNEISLMQQLEMDEDLLMDDDFCNGLDDTVMNCVMGCGWWVETSDYDFEQELCEECLHDKPKFKDEEE